MGVNPIIDNAATQQTAVALNNSVTVELKELEKKGRQEPGKNKVQSSSDISKLIQDGINPSKAGIDILASLASQLAATGVSLDPEKFSGKAKKELEDQFGKLFSPDESFSDMVQVNTVLKKAKNLNNNQDQNGNRGNASAINIDSETQGLVKEYAAYYAQYIVSNSQELKKKLEKIESLLQEKGLTAKDFISIKTSVTNSMRAEIKQQIRDAFFNTVLSKKKTIEFVINEKMLNQVLDFSLKKGVHDDATLQLLADGVREEAKEEIKDFAKNKMEESLMGKILSSDSKVSQKSTEELKELIKLASKVGIDLNEFSKDWKVKKHDLGLFVADIPLSGGGLNSDSQNKKEKNPYEFTKDDEKDLLINRLRAVYMHRALSGDLASIMNTYFKIRRLKNGLIKLGISSDEFKNIEKDGTGLARLRLIDMLKSALEERATLYELAGPAFKLIEHKIKGILENIKRLGWDLSDTEFSSLRDNANIKVLNAAKDEFLSVRAILKESNRPDLDKRLSLILKLMNRLKGESNLDLEIPKREYEFREAV